MLSAYRLSSRACLWLILFFFSLYGVFQFFYLQYAAFSVDEFWFAHNIYQYKTHLPYRDFMPYKSVLGYYLLLLPFDFAYLAPLLYTKYFIVAVNTVCFTLAALWAKKFFPSSAVLCTLALLLFSEFFLLYSGNLRVDIFAYWLCLLAVFLLFEQRFVWAGLCIGCAFLFSQKALWYICATHVGLFSTWIFVERTKKYFWQCVLFNLVVSSVILLYIGFWAYFSSLAIVLHNLFYEAYLIAALNWYETARKVFWFVTLQHNPLVFLIWPLTLFSLIITKKEDDLKAKRIFIIPYAFVLIVSLILYKQVFPYYMTAVIPAFFLLYIVFFAWLFDFLKNKSAYHIRYMGHRGIWAWLLIYSAVLCYVLIKFNLPIQFFMIVLLPFLLGMLITAASHHLYLKLEAVMAPALFFLLFLMGIWLPLTLMIEQLPDRNGAYQKSMLAITASLLHPDEDFVAGIPLFYNKDQPIAGLMHLVGPQLAYLHHPSMQLKSIMLSSLYLSPTNTEEVIHALEMGHVKLYVNNYRMQALPWSLKKFLASQYAHFWGSIYLYAPMVQAGNSRLMIKFAGKYQIESVQAITLDGKKFLPQATVNLTAGYHRSEGRRAYRLKLAPSVPVEWLIPSMQQDEWERMSVS